MMINDNAYKNSHSDNPLVLLTRSVIANTGLKYNQLNF